MSFELGGIALSITGVSVLMLSVLLVAALGYMLGRITIKGVALGTAGVFIIALFFGAFFYGPLSEQLVLESAKEHEVVHYAGNALKIVENIGLIFFVTAVGFIAGPNFFKNLKKNFKSYIVLGIIAIVAGGLTAAACIFIGRSGTTNYDELTAIVVGLLSGSLTSTPAFAATKEAVGPALEDAVTSGHAISYLFGVIGVVLFVQLVPKILGADMEEERAHLVHVGSGKKRKEPKRAMIQVDPFGLMAFMAAGALGLFIGSIKFFKFFSLTTTGGCLIVALVLGHFGRIGRINLRPQKQALEVFRELGLMMFLIGAGIPGGAKFVEYFKISYFIYGLFMTLVPMIVAFLFAKYVLKLSLLNNLGSVTGAMTSTPALGTLIHTAGTDDVASAYAATYPIALIAVVLVSQFLIILL